MPHPLIEIARGQHSLCVFPIEPAVVRNISHVPQLHRWTLFLDSLGKVLDGITIPEDGIDPLVLEAIQELAEHREYIAKAG